ncbi:hypothetical protein GGR52DRAFT_551180 [Hypoxylon sp. FL1284]|nr:hypothetical protein GGR52DRAFT_551180 [Hypoxylon sp. FL1284]
MSASRVLIPSFRAVSRRAAAPRSTFRRGYASGGHGGQKSSDMPWLVASVGITVPAVAWLLSAGGAGSPKKHADAADAHHAAPVPDEEKAPAVESGPSPSSDDKDNDDSGKNPPTNQQPQSGDPSAAHKSSQTGRAVPPAPADSSDMAADYEAKKQDHEGYKDAVGRRDTKVASSAEFPSKKLASEHPREDPLKGEGEAVRKGGPAKEEKEKE